MAYGDGRDDEALRTAWKQFCKRLEEAGDSAFKDYNPPSPLQRADAFRFLTQNLGQAFDLAYETKDPAYPVIHAFCTPFCKLGGDNADFIYQQAWIDGKHVYRISGNAGTVPFLNFAVQGARPAIQPGTDWPSFTEPFGDMPQVNLFGHEMKIDWDGSFELYIGGAQRSPNWLPTTPESRKIFIRQGFDRWTDRPGRFRIERVGMSEPRPVATPLAMIEAMDWAGDFLAQMMQSYPEYPFHYTPGQYVKYVNQFPPDTSYGTPGTDKRRGRATQAMYWVMKADEAMIFEFPKPEGIWMLTNMGMFWNSMDYLYRQVSYTTSRATTDSDGIVRLIMCHQDPGYHNWLDTQGFEQGNVLYRHLLHETTTHISAKIVKHAQLRRHLPSDSALVTVDGRRQQLWERFNGVRQRFSV